MHIKTNVKNFTPKNFVICDFYGTCTCFVWSDNDEFITFPYVCNESTIVSKVLIAPAKIKKIRGLNGRIFVLCYPHGIYKLTEKLEFAILSKRGFELVSEFDILLLNDGTLILENKTSETIERLLCLNEINSINILPLYLNNTHSSFYKAFAGDEYKSDINIYLLAIDKKLFKIINQTLQLIYDSEYSIESIIGFEKQNQVFGALLQTKSSMVILVHSSENKLLYDPISLGVTVQTIYPVLCADEKNSLLLVYSDNTKTYYCCIELSTNSVSQVKLEKQILVDIKLYQSNFIICLDDSSNLSQIPLQEIKNLCEEKTCDYIELQPNMVKGLESVIDIICEKTEELKILSKDILKKEDSLKRINMFINKQVLKYCPKDSVLRILNHLFLSTDYKKSLLKNCTVVKVLKCGGKIIFLMKDIHDHDTIVEMPINLSNLSSKLHTTTDLITYKNDRGIWCLIKDYIKDPLPTKSNNTILSNEKLNIIKYNLVVLKNLMKKNKLSLESLSEIKRKIRNATEL